MPVREREREREERGGDTKRLRTPATLLDELVTACRNGDELTACRILRLGEVDQNMSSRCRTAITEAAGNGNWTIVAHLIAQPSTNVNVCNIDGSTALNIACEAGDEAAVRMLLAHQGVNVNRADKFGDTPLSAASMKQRGAPVVRLLLAHPRIDANKTDRDGDTALNIACQEGHTETVRLLLEHSDTDVNEPNHAGQTPLFGACSKGHVAIVRVLLAQQGIDVNEPNHRGHTPFDMALANLFHHRPDDEASREIAATLHGARARSTGGVPPNPDDEGSEPDGSEPAASEPDGSEPAGLSPEAVERLGTVTHAAGCAHGTECGVCLEAFAEGDRLRRLPCGHAYHCACVDTAWFATHNTCPTCRAVVANDSR